MRTSLLSRRRAASVATALLVAGVVGGVVTAAPAAASPTASTATAAGIAPIAAPTASIGADAAATLPPPIVDAHAPALHATSYRNDVQVTDGVPERIGGTSRYATAAQIARLYGSAGAVIVANGSNAKGGFDALSANFLAGALAAPIVLTGGTTLEPETAAAVKAVLTGSTDPAIYVMGQEDSVSAAAADTLNTIASSVVGAPGDYVHRIGGAGRYATSALAVTSAPAPAIGMVNLGHGALPTAILASGTSNSDALAAGPLSYAWSMPVLLTAKAALPSEIADVISTFGIKQLVVLGGTDRVGDSAITQAKAAGVVRAVRIAGKNRFATAAELYGKAASGYAGADGKHYLAGGRAFVANGVTGFADALAVGPLAGSLRAPLLTAAASSVDGSTLTVLDAHRDAFAALTALGTASSVSNNVVIALRSAARINILAGSDGILPATADKDATFVAAAGKLSTFADKVKLARTFLPNGGAAISTLYPYMLAEYQGDAAGLEQPGTCEVWLDNTLDDDQILDTLVHEYIHALQCRAENAGYRLGYVADPTAIGGVERGADAGTYLLGFGDLYYAWYGPTAGPIRISEFVQAEKLLAHFGIPYHLG